MTGTPPPPDPLELRALGWDDEVARLVAESGADPAAAGRVARVDRGLVTVVTGGGSVRAAPAPALRSSGPLALPATGDWVLVAVVDGEVQVVTVLARRSVFVRGDPYEGVAKDAQVIAANLDTVFLVHALTNGPNPRRIERELVLVYESGATPVIVLTKADLVDDLDGALETVARVAPGVEVVVTSAVSGQGVDDLRRYATGGRTVALIGASGVGKSTLVNALVGDEVQDTGEVRASDQRGRHTTTARELVLLPSGGVLVDTPGLRAVALWEADEGFAQAFADIETLATQCRFADCAHRTEPGCSVRDAVERGELDQARLESYRRLDQELDAATRRRRERILSRAIRRAPKRR